MTKKSIVFLSIFLATAVLIAGGVLWYANEVKKEIIKTSKEQMEIKIPQGNQDIDTSDWKTYRNEKLGFEIKYPKNWSYEEKEEGGYFDTKTIFRYVTFKKATSDAHINFGLKDISEKYVVPREFNTGIPGGDFVDRGDISFGEGVANEKDLMDCYNRERECSTELIWFCKGDDCVDFPIGSEKVAFLEARGIGNENGDEFRMLLRGILRSFRFIDK